MTRILIPLTLSILLMLSCQGRKSLNQEPAATTTVSNTKKDKVVKKDSIIPATWQSVNNRLEKKYHTRIETEDILRIYKLLLKEKLIDKKALVYDSYYPTFTHLSPSIMLRDVSLGSQSPHRPEEMKVFSMLDTEFILGQLELLYTDEFKWSSIIDNTTNADTYPRLTIGIPVFSADKKKCIVGIEEFESKFCRRRISYLFVTTGSKTKYYVFEKVTSC
jgi:hypothetical protein